MTKDLISTIIKSKKVTGDDIGRLLLADMAEEYKTFLKTGQVKSIISQDEFNKLLNSLTNNYQIERYNRYVNIHNTIKTYMSVTRGTGQIVETRLEFMKRLVSNLKTKLQAINIKDAMPLILTQKQYNDLMQKYDEKAEATYSYFSVFMQFINTQVNFYMNAKEDNPEETKADAKIDRLIKKYKKEVVKNPEVRRAYNAMYSSSEDGFFKFKMCLLPIGENREEFIHNCALQNIKPIEEKLRNYKAKDLKKPVDEVFINDVLTPAQVEEYIDYELYNTSPKTIYKADIIDGDLISDNYNTFTEDKEEQKEILQLFTQFSKEVPELIDLIKFRMSKYKCLKPYTDTAIKDMFKIVIKREDLIRDDVPEYKSWNMYCLREDYHRAYNGIAIRKEDILGRYDKENIIDEQGYYRQENENLNEINIMEDSYLQALMGIGKEDSLSITNNLYPNLQQVYAFNTFIDMIADLTSLPIVKEAFTYDTQGIELGVIEYNQLLFALLNFTITTYGSSGHYEEARDMREKIFNILPYVDINKGAVTPENRERALEFVSDFNNFKGISATSKPFYILCGWSDLK